MRPELAAVAANQGGLVTRRQTMEAGYTTREIRTLTGHNGRWMTVRRGVYMSRDLWDSLDERRGRPLRRVAAAHLAMTKEHAMSHGSAALLHGLPTLNPRDGLVHISRPGVTGSRTEHGVKHHRAAYLASQVVSCGGMPALDLARTVVDIGREHGYLHGLVAADAALQLGATRADLARAIDPMTSWPGITAARAALAECDDGAESIGESLSRVLLIEAGLTDVETQFPVIVGSSVGYVDLRVRRHLFEFDGEVKYLPTKEGGVATRSASEAVVQEKQRQDAICAQGFGMTRLIWRDVWGSGREAAKTRILREFAATCERFGTELPADYPDLPQRVRRAA